MRVLTLLIGSIGMVMLSYAQTSQQIGNTTVIIDTVTSDLNFPWEMKLEGDHHLWVTERGGLVSRINVYSREKTVVLDLTSSVHAVGESGLLGLALHPDFLNNPDVFLVYTYGPEDSGGYFHERVVKYTFDGTTLVNPDTLLENILAWSNHDGSRLFFLPDNTLLMSTGECYLSQLAQDSTSLSGKYLRMNMDGTIPIDNPIPGSYIYTMGHRNSQGICGLPNGKIIISEHGPETDDELQILEKGKNYGWPLIHGFCDEPFEDAPCATGLYQEPIHVWTPTIATSDLVYYENWSFPEWNQRLLMVTLNGQRLVAMELDTGSTMVVDEDQYFMSQFGRLRDIEIGVDKEIYIATNSGTNGHPIIRISPPYESTGLNEHQNESFLVLPNPANNSIRISTDEFLDQVDIVDLNGETVLKMFNFEAGESIDISALASGSYFVEFWSVAAGKTLRQKLVKN